MTNLVSFRLASASLLATVFALLSGCATGKTGNFTPLSQTNMNRTYKLTSAANVAHIAAFTGPINNTPPHAQSGENYYSDANATFTITPDATGSLCSSETFTLTGRLTNKVEGTVNIDLSGSLAGGTMKLSGVVTGTAAAGPSAFVNGTYSVDGGSCAVAQTNFSGAVVNQNTTTAP